MRQKISPLEYISYHAPVQPNEDAWKKLFADDDHRNVRQLVQRRARDMQPPMSRWNSAFRGALRRCRFELIKSDPTVMDPGAGLERKYLIPTLTILNERLLRYNAPRVRCVEIADEPWRTFIIGFWTDNIDPEDPSEQYWYKRRLAPFDFEETPRVAMCVVAFLPPGSLKVEYVGTGIQERTVHMPRAISRELDRVYELCTHYNAPLGMLTDEALSVAINGIERIKYSDDPPVLELSTSFAPTDPVQVAIGGMLHVLGCRNMAIFHTKSPPLQPYLGAVVEHAPTLSSLDEAIATRYAFEDWDLFTMQRCRDEWYLFWDWQHELRRRALVRPLDKGDTLKIKLGSDFGTRHFLMRSPYPKQPLPSEGYSIFATQARPRDDVIDAIFRDSGECDRLSDQHVVFTVSEVRRSGRLGYSQVVFGTLVNNSTKLCLKLYDERFFAIEEVEGYDDPLVQCDPAQRFNDLMTATYLARNEETIYDRLSELQGSLLPYYYGIRRVELPDGTTVWGLLTEFIEGPIIEHIDARDWSREAQIDFIRRMRHLFRALRYAGVTHNDDSPRNLLCPNIGVRGSGAPGIVLIDFAFSDPWLNDDRGTPPVYDSPTDKPHFRPLLLHVGISKDLVNEQWEPLDELEI